MDELWTRLENFLRQNAPQVYDSLAPGATEEEIADAEEACGVKFPPDIRQSYLRHDGQLSNSQGYPIGGTFIAGSYQLMPISRVASESGEMVDDNTVPYDDAMDPRVRHVYSDVAWVPFAEDLGGNSIRFDFDPLPGGTVGQIILWDHEEDIRPILASNLTDWLSELASELEAGRLVWNEELKGYRYPEKGTKTVRVSA